jgi:Kef-type K+ transport system membrane component KefB
MSEFALLLLAAGVAHGLARGLRLPSLPLLILAGMALRLLQQSGLLPGGMSDAADGGGGAAERLLEFGLVFLVFASGVELSPNRFTRRGRAVFWVGFGQFVVCAGAGYGIALAMGYAQVEAAYLGFGLAASSTVVVLRQLRLRQAMFEPFGRVVTGVLLLQDALMIVAMVALARLGGGAFGIAVGLGEVVLLGAVAWLTQRRLIPWLLVRMKPDEESLLLWLVAVLFLFSGISLALGLPAVVGAFAGGFAFSAFPLNGLVRGQLSSLSDFFHALFFVALGALVGVPDAARWWTALQFSAIIILLTPVLVAVLAEWRGLNARASIESGLLLAQTSEFSLLLGLSGLALGHISGAVFEVLAMTTLITMTLTPFLSRDVVARSLLALHPLRRLRPPGKPPRDHILLLGFGAAGMWTVKPFRAQGEEILVVDDDPVVCRELIRLKVPVLRGDGSDKEVLGRAGASHAKLVIVSMRRVADAIEVIRRLPGVPVVVRVFEESEENAVTRAGGIAVSNSHAAAEMLLRWIDSTSRLPHADAGENPIVRQT